MKNNIIIHIPHSSFYIPQKYKKLFYLTKSELKKEQLKMTDSYTNELFDLKNAPKIIFPISRLICDVERFRDEKDEEMTNRGMWVCYTKTSDLKPLKKVVKSHKTEILYRYYDKHHIKFSKFVENLVDKYKKCLIIDAHSFSSKILPYEIHSNDSRPDICIGTDEFHTPKYIEEFLTKSFRNFGYIVEVNNPFCGSIVPLEYYRQNKNVMSIMIEINRSLYMDEESGSKKKDFIILKENISKILTELLKNRFK